VTKLPRSIGILTLVLGGSLHGYSATHSGAYLKLRRARGFGGRVPHCGGDHRAIRHTQPVRRRVAMLPV